VPKGIYVRTEKMRASRSAVLKHQYREGRPVCIAQAQAVLHTPEVNAARSAGIRRSWADPVIRAKMIAASRYRANTPEGKINMAKVVMAARTPEANINRSNAAKHRMQTPEGQIQMEKCQMASIHTTTNTKCHLVLQAAITAAGFSFDTEHAFYPYHVDCYIPEANLALEADGDYWHDAKKDAVRDAYIFEHYGVATIRFPEAMLLRKGNWDRIIDMIQVAAITVAEQGDIDGIGR